MARKPPEALKPFYIRPGQILRRSRPEQCPGTSFNVQLRQILNSPCEDNKKITNGRRIIEIAVEAAQNGHFNFFKEIFDRLEGKVPEHIIANVTEKYVEQEATEVAEVILNVINETLAQQLPPEQVDIIIDKLCRAIAQRLNVPTAYTGDLSKGIADAAPEIPPSIRERMR